MLLNRAVFSCSDSKRAFSVLCKCQLNCFSHQKTFAFLVALILPQLTYQSLNGEIGDMLQISKPPTTPSKSSFPFIDFILASNSVSSAVSEPPPVLRAKDIFPQIIACCLANTFNHFLGTSSLFLKVPFCDHSWRYLPNSYSFLHKREMNIRDQIVLTYSL